MYTIFKETMLGQSTVKEYITRDDLTIAEENLQWERQMDPYDMIWEEDNAEV